MVELEKNIRVKIYLSQPTIYLSIYQSIYLSQFAYVCQPISRLIYQSVNATLIVNSQSRQMVSLKKRQLF